MRLGRGGAKYDNARNVAGAIVVMISWNQSAVMVAGCNARDVRAIKADIGQFAIAELGQFSDVSLIVSERPDEADEREQHGILLTFQIQSLSRTLISEAEYRGVLRPRNSECCDAAKLDLHGFG